MKFRSFIPSFDIAARLRKCDDADDLEVFARELLQFVADARADMKPEETEIHTVGLDLQEYRPGEDEYRDMEAILEIRFGRNETAEELAAEEKAKKALQQQLDKRRFAQRTQQIAALQDQKHQIEKLIVELQQNKD